MTNVAGTEKLGKKKSLKNKKNAGQFRNKSHDGIKKSIPNDEQMSQEDGPPLKKIKEQFHEKKKKFKQNNAEKFNKSPKRKSTESTEASPSKKMKLHKKEFKKGKLASKQGEGVAVDIVKNLKLYWEDLRCKDSTPEKKSQRLKQICVLVKDRVKEFASHHDTVRVLECVLAEGTEEHRSLLYEEVKDDIVGLSKSKYGKFLVMKILRYGSKPQKEAIINAFKGVVTELMKHTVAAEVVEFAFNECANASQRFQMVQEFYGASFRHFKTPNIHNLKELLEKESITKESVISFMKEELMKLLDKTVVKHSLIHYVLLQFFLNCDPSSRSDMIESLREVVPEILHTKDGSRVAMHCVWYGTQKDRKVIIKHMKTFVSKIAMEEHGHMVLLSLFDCVDDTTLIDKVIIKELQEKLLEIAQNVHGKKVLVYLLNPRDPHFFHPDIINILKTGDNNESSKKDPEIRRQELRKAIAGPLSELIINNIANMYKDNAFCLFTVTILKHVVGVRRKAFESIAKLTAEPYTSENKNVHAIEYSGSYFMLKQLISNDTTEQAEGRNLDSATFSEVLVSAVPKNVMKTWFNCNRGAFILLNLLETEIPAVVKQVSEEMMGCHKQLNKLRFKGAELLVKKLKSIPVNSNCE